MRRYSANFVFPISQPPIKNGIVEVSDDGAILNIIDPGQNFKEIHSTEFHNGVIVPGFINTHCHIELSHLAGKFDKGQGIAGFIKSVAELRGSDEVTVNNAIHRAIADLERFGTVAVGDICNTSGTLVSKFKSNIYFQNFIEVFGINPISSNLIIEKAIALRDEFAVHYPLSTGITPHSTYSLSNELWSLVGNELQLSNSPVSIHFAESMDEYMFLENGAGALLNRYKQLKVPFDIPNESSPAQVVLQNILPNKQLLLIHNTFAGIDELLRIHKHFQHVTFVTCPESNLFIEGTLPNLSAMNDNNLSIAIGTDSLASASSLSMLNQILILIERFPSIPFNDILKWATLNGAKALNVANAFGSIDVGKKPGINLITNFNFDTMRPTKSSMVRRLF